MKRGSEKDVWNPLESITRGFLNEKKEKEGASFLYTIFSGGIVLLSTRK